MKFLLFLFLIPAVSFSQTTDYKKGFIVKANNDTLFGLIELKEQTLKEVLVKIKFKINEQDKPDLYSPDDLKEFVRGNKKYVSKYFDVKKRNYFFYLKIEGYLSYYELDFNNWMSGGITTYILLQKQNDENVITYEYKSLFPFKKRISEYLKDDPELAGKIKHNIYNDAKIQTIVKEYNIFMQANSSQK